MSDNLKPVRILAIAPYEGMRNLMLNIAEERDDIDLTVFVGNRTKGLEAVEREDLNNYDVIISRGGTTQIIKEHVTLPTIDIKLSVYDILCSLKLAENCNGKYAVIGFPAVTKDVRLLCESMQRQIDIFTVHRDDEITPFLEKLQERGYSLFISDTISDFYAKKNGMNSILITSSRESIVEAFNTAVYTHTNQKHLRTELALYKMFLSNCPFSFSIVDADGIPVLSSYATLEKNEAEALFSSLKKCETNDALIQYRRENSMLFASKTHFHCDSVDYTGYFCHSAPVPPIFVDDCIRYFNRNNAIEYFLQDFYGVSSVGLNVFSPTGTSNIPHNPAFIVGEDGTGKDQTAVAIYAQSALRERPFVLIDCRRINKKSWNYLLNHTDSPLLKEQLTIYFRHVYHLSDQAIYELISYIKDTNLQKRHFLIFSGLPDKTKSCVEELKNEIGCLPLILPPLRVRKDEIPTLASLYISSLNLKFAKQVIGFQADAMKMLVDFSWPQNLSQFRRVIIHAVSITTGAYITAKSAHQALRQEGIENLSLPYLSLDLERPLADIELDIVKRVLASCDNSQSKAAQQLQISRSTLWRMLKQDKNETQQ